MLLATDDGVAEAKLLHPSEFGFFALMRKTAQGGVSQRMYGLDRLEDVVRGMRSTPDAYISQASFVKPMRRMGFLGQMRAAFVDLDCYALGETPSDSFVADVLAKAREIGLPEPSYVVGSGRGLYAKWIFDNPVGAGKLMQWNALQSSLNLLYRAIGADARAKDAARVLRVLGTTNSKAQGGAGVVRIRHDSGSTHGFDELCGLVAASKFAGYLGGYDDGAWRLAQEEDDGDDETCRSERPSLALLCRTANHVAGGRPRPMHQACTTDLSLLDTFEQVHRPILLKQNTVKSLNWHRFLDLRNLAMQRGRIHQGTRDQFLFWMMTFLGHAEVVTPKNFWDEARDLSSIIATKDFLPIKDGSLGTLYRKLCDRHAGRKVEHNGGMYDPLYTASNAHLIDVLEISSAEQQDLLTLIDGREKSRRVDAKNPERVERREMRIQWRAEAAPLIAAGAPLREVAATTGAPLSRVKHLSRQIAATSQGAPKAACDATGAVPITAWHAQAQQLRAQGMLPAAIARELGVHRSSVGRFLKAAQGRAAGTLDECSAANGVVPETPAEAPFPAASATASETVLITQPFPATDTAAREAAAQTNLQRFIAQQTEAARLTRERDEMLRQAEIQQRALQLANQVERLRMRACVGAAATEIAPWTAARRSSSSASPTTLQEDADHAQQAGDPPEQGTYRESRPGGPATTAGVPRPGAAFREHIERRRQCGRFLERRQERVRCTGST